MKKLLSLLILGIFLLLFLSCFSSKIKAQNDSCADSVLKENDPNQFLTDAKSCLDNLTQARNQSITATVGVQKQIDTIKTRVASIESDLVIKQKDIDDGYKNLAKLEEILDRTIRDYYIKSYLNSPLATLLSASSASEITQALAYQKATTDQDKVIITNIAITILDLETKKKDLEAEKASLAIVKGKLDKVVADARAYQASLSNKIAALSARQQEILSQRLSALGIPLFASSLGACSSDIGRDPGFGGGFGFFTYGVPNRVGLNQYGAFGRAKAGQSYDTILHAYYNFDSIEKRDATINVDGYGSYSLDDYVKHIYEVPNEWGDQGGQEALKAQAIAARSYALAYTNNGSGSICTTQECQVFQGNVKTGNWEQAVNDTSGLVMIQGGSPVKAWFSSTHGGYIHSSGDIGWADTSFTKNAQDASGAINNFSNLKNNAYDKDSPWFYCDWGGRSDYNKTAWLKSDEVADIVNVVMLARADSSVNEHLYQTDKSNPAGTDTWDAGRVKTELQNRGITPFNSVSGINVDVDWGAGKVTTVHVSGDASDPSISGNFFKLYFDLRAPANIQIVGPLYNVERN
jgi:SpoIID/LytB domain protein